MNFVFISPNFPHTYWQFCAALRGNGIRVLGIGDSPYDSLEAPLKAALTEYYRVDSLEDYDQVYRAVAYFAFRYGKIDWIESMNEYWLEQDARLRTDFHVTTGIQEGRIGFIKEKSLMKRLYLQAEIPTARQSDRDLEAFYDALPETPYVMEEFIEGIICSYDAIVDADCEPLFESMTVWPPVMDIVNKDLDLMYYTCPEVPEALRKLGRRTVKAFGVDRRFVHLEFFRLTKARKGLGKVGDFVALEVNMRPAGGYTPDMMNFAHETDVYQIYADMVAFNSRRKAEGPEHFYCVYASRKDGHSYTHTHEEILARYGGDLVMQEEMPPMNWPQMGRYMYTARLKSFEDAQAFIHFVQG